MPSRKSRRKTIAPTQVRYLEGTSWPGELPPVGPQFAAWLDQNTHSLKLASKYGDVESVDELLELLKTPCIQPHHPDKPDLTISVCEQIASKIRSLKPYAANDDISDMLNAAALDIEKEWIPFWQKYNVTGKMIPSKKLSETIGDIGLQGMDFSSTQARLMYQNDNIFELDQMIPWYYSNKKDYDTAESEIEDMAVSKPFYQLYTRHDTSGYDYWIKKQNEPNYIDITVRLTHKGLPEDQVDDLVRDIETFYRNLSKFEIQSDNVRTEDEP